MHILVTGHIWYLKTHKQTLVRVLYFMHIHKHCCIIWLATLWMQWLLGCWHPFLVNKVRPWWVYILMLLKVMDFTNCYIGGFIHFFMFYYIKFHLYTYINSPVYYAGVVTDHQSWILQRFCCTTCWKSVLDYIAI